MIWRRELRPEAKPVSLRFRPPNIHIPLWLMAAGWAVALTGRALLWAARHPRTTVTVAVAGWLVALEAVTETAVAVCLLAGVLCLWWAMWPGSFARWIADPARLRLREWLVYRRNWQPAMLTSGLTLRDSWGGDLPTLRRVASEPGRDLLRVAMLPGQTLEQWSAATAGLAQTFGVRSVRVRRIPDRPRELVLVIARRGTVIRHVTQSDAVEEPEAMPKPRGAFPRQPHGAT